MYHSRTIAPARNASSARAEAWARHAPLAICAYFLIQFLIRLFLSPNLEVDDAEMVSQIAWAWGYANSHPPLYSWIVHLAHSLTGNWVAATAAPKYALLAAAYLLVHDTVRRASGSHLTAALSVAALIFMPVVAWKTQGKLSHSIVGFAATAATLHAVGLILSDRRCVSFAWLGVAAAMGVLSKYNYAFVLAGLVVAVLLVPQARKAFATPRSLIGVAVLLLLTAPHLIWLRSHMAQATERLYVLQGQGEASAPGAPGMPLDGLVSLATVLLISIGPPIAAWLMATRVAGAGRGARLPEASPAAPNGQGAARLRTPMQRLAGLLFAASIAAFALASVLGGFHKVHERYLLVLLPAFAVFLALRWPLHAQPRAGVAILATALVAALGITVARPVTVLMGANRLTFPYGPIAAGLIAEAPGRTIVSDRPENAANLVIRLPGSSMYDLGERPARVLAIADQPSGLAAIRQALGGAYVAEGEVRRLCAPYPQGSPQLACLTVQSWRSNDGPAALPQAAPSPNPGVLKERAR